MTKEQLDRRRERDRIKSRKHREADRERYNAKMREYRKRSQGRVREQERARRGGMIDQINARRRERYQLRRETLLKAGKEWRRSNPEKILANNLRRYGVTISQFAAMRDAQNGACAICREAFVRRPRIDHCHSTGENRALLCDRCNLGLGHFKDNPERLEAAAAYIREHRRRSLAIVSA